MPSGDGGRPVAGVGGVGNGPCCATVAPGCPVQCPGPHWPRETAEKPRKCAGLRVLASRAFGEEGFLFWSLLFGRSVIMLVSMGAMEQFGNGSTEEAWQLKIQVPNECEHQAGNHALE